MFILASWRMPSYIICVHIYDTVSCTFSHISNMGSSLLSSFVGNFPIMLVTGVIGHTMSVLRRLSRRNSTVLVRSAVTVTRPLTTVMISDQQLPVSSYETLGIVHRRILCIAPAEARIISRNSVVNAAVLVLADVKEISVIRLGSVVLV